MQRQATIRNRIFFRIEEAETYLNAYGEDRQPVYIVTKVIPKTKADTNVYMQLEIQPWQLRNDKVVPMVLVEGENTRPVVFHAALIADSKKNLVWEPILSIESGAISGKEVRKTIKDVLINLQDELTRTTGDEVAKKLAMNALVELGDYVEQEGKKYQLRYEKSLAAKSDTTNLPTEENPKLKAVLEKLTNLFKDYNGLRALYLKGVANRLAQGEYEAFTMKTTSSFHDQKVTAENAESIMQTLVIKIGNELVKLHGLQLANPENQNLQRSIERFHGDLTNVNFRFFGEQGEAILKGVFHETPKPK